MGLAHLGARHALEGLLLRALEELDEPGGAFLEAARAMALPAVAGNLRRMAELHRVLGVLEEAQVPALALKGPALAVQAYGDVSLRSYADVDVLVPPAAAQESVQALVKAGYADRRSGSGRMPSPQHWHDWGFTAPDGQTLVEVHWFLTSPRRFPAVDSGEAWDPSGHTRVAIGGRTVPALRPELLLPLLAIHGTSHSWGWLEFPASVAGLVERTGPDLDWETVAARVRRWRVRRITSVALLLAGDLFGAPTESPPESVRRTLLEDQGAGALARWYRSHLLLDPETEWYRGSPALWWRKVRMADSAPQGLRTGWQLLFSPTPAEWEAGEGAEGSAPRAGPGALALRRVRRLFRRYRERR
jgi:hypothetical protein